MSSVLSMGLLLMASLILILHYSKREVRIDTIQKASQTLDATIASIDNVMLTVEQTTGNIYISLQPFMDDSEKVREYAQKIVDTNPCVIGCNISFDQEYLKQDWLSVSMQTGLATWKNRPMKAGKDKEPIITYIMPMTDRHGVITVDMSLNLLSKIVLAAKPSEHSYCVLLDSDGSFIVHPNSLRLNNETVFDIYGQSADRNITEAAHKMVTGESGYMPFNIDDTRYYVFYKPFERSFLPHLYNDDMNWSAGIIYPENDIYGEYNTLKIETTAIAIIGLIMMFLFCYAIIHRQLKPLLMLTERAKSLAKGKYNDPIPDTHHQDEIGRLQSNFQQMQQRLAMHAEEVEQLTNNYRKHGEELSAAYARAKKADQMMTDFMHNMTNQMIPPAHSIFNDVKELSDLRLNKCTKSIDEMASDIERNSQTITNLLSNLLSKSDNDRRKEAYDE
ncbi:MAG: HAMP domain-containing protein [Prevotella sp.]|nr:HAMP domain-containing protein [Prevotella sp.]